MGVAIRAIRGSSVDDECVRPLSELLTRRSVWLDLFYLCESTIFISSLPHRIISAANNGNMRLKWKFPHFSTLCVLGLLYACENNWIDKKIEKKRDTYWFSSADNIAQETILYFSARIPFKILSCCGDLCVKNGVYTDSCKSRYVY